MKQALTISLLFFSFSVFGQNVKALTEGMNSPDATLNEVSWISGHWLGDMMGNTIEEIWTEPMGGSMMGSFRMAYEEEIKFYELMTITEENSTLMLKIKHFNADLTGWEEKDETVDFPLVEIKGTTAYFSGLTFESVNENQLNIYVNQESGDEIHEIKFTYFKK